MRSPKDSSGSLNRFRSYASDHLTLWSMLLVLAMAGTLPAVLAGAKAARERESVATSVESKVFVEPAIQPLGPFATFTVNSLGDAADTNTADNVCDSDAAPNEQCTLRAATEQANATAGDDTIDFDPEVFAAPGPHVIQLTGALPDLSSDMTINGPSASLLSVRGEGSGSGNSYRIFTVMASVTVNISGLTVTNGSAAPGAIGAGNVNGDHGGGIRNDGTLTLTGVAVSGNRAGNGGGIAILGGSGGNGGGIYNVGMLTVSNCTISGNVTGPAGNATAIPFTSGQSGQGGGIYNAGTLTISNSTISDNLTPGGGGGGGGQGGGINSSAGPLTVSNCTITANTALGSFGGGIQITGGVVTLRSTIVAGNSASVSPDINGPVQSDGFNLIGDTTGATINPNPGAGPDITGVSPNLGPLADNGGHTQTHRLLPNSPAIDNGNDFSATATDQRGQTRPFDNPAIAPASNMSITGDNSDIGAVEVNYAISATSGTPQTATPNSAFATQLQATVTEAGQAVSGVNVTFTAPASGASGTFQGTGTNTATVTTDGSGLATAPVFTANGVIGSYSVIASIGTGLPTATFSLANSNPPPTNTAASGLSRQQGSPATNSQIATVTDDGGNGSVVVTVISANPSNGVTISKIENASGNITADIVADCTASNATFTLQASDGESIATDTLNVIVIANTAPSLTYSSPQTASFNGSLTVTPAAASDNGTVSYQVLAGHGLTTAPTVDSSGVVSITNAQPHGAHTITVRATDNCGLITDSSFTLNVPSPATLSGTKTVSGTFNVGNTVTYTIVLSNSGPAAQLDNPGNEFTDVLPSGLALVSAAATSGTATTAANTVNWNGSIPAGGSVTITITATINNVPDGTIVSNQGTISYDADGNGTNEASRLTDDPAVGGASDPTSFAVSSKSDLTITKSHVGNFSAGQVGATYIITVTNIGTGITSGQVTVTDVVPVGLTPTGPNASVGGWLCSIIAQVLTCTRSDVLAGGGVSYPAINLTVNVANPAPLNVTNTATVSGGGEVNTNNNTANDPTTINCSPNFALNNSSPLMTSRFRENGPAGPQDEFVEIYNPTQLPHTVASGNCNGGGYGVYASEGNGTTSNTATLVCYIPNGTVIPAGGYYLCTGVTYSLSNLGLNGGAAGATALGDSPIGCGGTCGANIPDDAGLALVNKAAPTLPGGFGILEFGDVVFDKVGFGPYVGFPTPGYPLQALTYCEGGAAGCLKPVGDASTGAACANPTGQFPVFPILSGPPACYGLAGQYEFLRRQTTFDAIQGTLHQDTNNNGNDFILVAPNPATNMGAALTGVTGVTAVLGTAGPYNRHAAPDMPAVKLTRSPFDGGDQLGPRNMERRYIPDPTVINPANNPLGTLTLRFRYTNNSGIPINGMRFSVDNLSTLCGPQQPVPTTASVGTGDARNVGSTPGCGTGSFTAILKALNSTSEVLVDGGGTAQFVNGTVMEDLSVGAAPGAGPLSPNGGGIDNTFIINPSMANVSVGDGVSGGVGNFATTMGTGGPTKEIRVQVKFGVVRNGRFILLLVPMARNSPAP